MRASDKFQRWLLIGADSLIKQYFAIRQDRLIERRLEEIRNPWKPTDENIGGGKGSNRRASKQEIMFEKIESDPLLKQYQEVINKVEEPLRELDGNELNIIVTLYDCQGNSSTGRNSDKKVATILNAPVKSVAGVRKKFIQKVAQAV